ncbi:MAG: PSD1 and planctomycete cytochrome C domain-containing protein [Verrucomicrobiota bacterium]|jgi:hypothetical protein
MSPRLRPFCFIAVSVLGLPTLFAADQADDTVRFNRDIRPIMSDTCFHCHGFDAKARKGELRLDIREFALKAGKSGEIAIVPGKPEASEIIKRIFTKDDDDLMPAKESHKTLTPEQKELFRRWVKQGANYEAHWAYTPLAPVAVPPMPAGGRSPIDAFIGKKLAEKKIAPSAEASKEKLLRRVSLDLTGLPPTPEELAAFLADQSPNAYEKQVDRLLASPHYGERMAVWWLDIARFADTVGFHGDQNQRIFPYRDYVINAFNGNKPFDAFTREQLAGDLLPNATEEQKVASGYNRLNMMTREGGAQPKEYLAKYGAERVRSVSAAWLGSTFGCAECHDHKFDPIKAADFYTLQSFFADVKQWGVYADYSYTPEPELKGVNNDSPFPPEIKTTSPYLQKQDARTRREIEAFAQVKTDPAKVTAWMAALQPFTQKNADGWLKPAGSFEIHKVAAAATPAKKGAKVAPSPSAGTIVESSLQPITTGQPIVLKKALAKGEDLVVALKPGALRVAAVRLSLPEAKAGSRSSLTVGFTVRNAAGKERKLAVGFSDAADHDIKYSGGAENLGIGNTWALTVPVTGTASAVWLLDTPVDLAEGDALLVAIDGANTQPIQVSVTPFGGYDPLTVGALPRSPADQAVAYLCSVQPARADFDQVKVMAAKLRDYRRGVTWSLVTEARLPITVRILPRGNFLDTSGPVVLPATPSFLPGYRQSTEQKRLTRLDLANWLTSKENPITARTVMNRLWQIFHGSGLSANLDDLGSQGEPPSHPELLDWLSVEFRDHDWDVKRMARLMVTSRTYRQSSSLRPEIKEIDPNNRWLASQNPRRLDAEFIRDNALAIAGLLNAEDVGGPSVKPYQPEGHYEPLQFPNRSYAASKDAEQWRRGLYMHWQRMFLHPMLVNFDAPARDECVALRSYSNTPQQALTLLNDPTFVEAARVLATRLLAKPTTEDRLNGAFILAVGRQIKASERTALEKLIADQKAYYTANPAEATKLLKVGLTPPPTDDPATHAAWTQACRVLLNSHEVITRY